MGNMQQKLELIVNYIHEKKGVWITPIPPMNGRQMMLMDVMSRIAYDYFESKKTER